jgi:hypothetical protein
VRSILRPWTSPSVAALTLATIGVTVIAQPAVASHVRPQGASPVRVSLVPAYKQCVSPNRTHGAPLTFPSCSQPVQASNFLTLGTPDANGAGAKSVGFVELKAKSTSPGEVLISFGISDVRCLPGTDASVCSGANSAGGPDYSGTLQVNATIRVSDHYNGPNLNEAATVQDFPFPATIYCTNTADPSIGGLCNDPGPRCLGCPPPPDGQRAVLELTQIQVLDGGADGWVGTQDNTLFEVQGLFIP